MQARTYRALEKRPDFIQLKSQELEETHRNQAKLGFDQAMVSANYVIINLDALNIIKGNNGEYINVENSIQMAGQQIVLRLPGFRNSVALNVDTAYNLSSKIDIITYSGTVQNHKNSRFVISVSELEGIIGTINIDKYVYNILPAEKSNKYLIVKSEKSMIPRNQTSDVDGSDAIAKALQPKQNIVKSSNGNGLVKVLFYHTSDVSSPYSTASNTVSEMNDILDKSGITQNNRISLAYTGISIPLNTTLSGQCRLDILNQMKARHGAFVNIDQDLLIHGADIAVAFFKGNASSNPTGTYCRVGGYAALYGLDVLPSQGGIIGDSPFAAIADNYSTSSGDLTGAHEIGHILGGKHASENNDIIPNFPKYSRGFVYISSTIDFQTVMGGYTTSGCGFTGPYPPYSCERIARFSNPDPNPKLLYNGQTLGVTNSRDMKSWLNAKMTGISNWTGNPLPIPSSPNLSTANESCFGMNSANWNATNNATEYKLYKSTSPGFLNPNLIYNGVNTLAFVSVNSGTWYLRVKACNAAGCSAYSNQGTASYYNGCL